jgi:hypothetical protein
MTLLSLTCFLLFAGRAWQHLFLDAPFRVVLWNQDWLEPWVARQLGMTWESYVSHPGIDASINGIIRGFGALYTACALACLPWGPWKTGRTVLIGAGAFSLLALSLLYGMEKFMRVGEFIEYASQWMAPVLLLLVRTRASSSLKVAVAARLAIAATFIGHGLYAVGYYPVPGQFVDMVIMHLGVSETVALRLLHWAGVMDFLVAAGILLPFRLSRPFLAYAMVWGALTALARLLLLFDGSLPGFGMKFFLPEILYRIPHSSLALWLLLRGGADKQAGNGIREPS